MKKPDRPDNEARRLTVLRELCILDTPPEERFDRITRLARRLFDVPIALVSLVDADRQWFKSRQGLDATQTPRDLSFCGHAILSDHTFVIEDATKDPRFADNPLVTGPPNVCFYAGQPLKAAEGNRVGTLCIIDHEARDFPTSSRALLADLAVFVEQELNERALARAVAEAEISRSKLHGILDNVIDGIITIDGNGTVESFNRAAECIFGYVASEVIGCNVNILMPEPYRSQHDGYLSNYQANGVRRIIGIGREVTGRRKDGSEFPMDLAVSEFARNGRRAYIGIARDITARKEVERVKNEFISTVSHELRTPLTSIMGTLDLLGKGVAGELPPEASPLVEIAHRNAVRLVRLINDILDIDKIESRKLHFDVRVHELQLLIAQAIAANRDYAGQFGAGLVLERELPRALVMVDGDRLQQVLANLLSNAAKFSPPGADITIALDRLDGWLRVAVTDRGPGIPPEFEPRMFEKFSQADSSNTRRKDGSGLGLNIAKALVEQMGGRIGFTSRPGAGTTFFVEFPEAASLPEASAPADAQRVLICEDDRDVARLVQMILKEADYAADTAYDAEQAKRMLRQRRYSALTVDIALPGRSGVDLIRELRANAAFNSLPIVVVSANAERGRQELGGAISVVDWLEKPIDPARLVAALRRGVPDAVVRRAILHVEDDPDVTTVVGTLLRGDYDVLSVPTLAAARTALRQRRFDLIILDMKLPDGCGSELLPAIQALTAPPPVLIFSAHEYREEMQAMIAAALVKSQTSNSRLIDTIRRLTARPGEGPARSATPYL